MRSRMGPAMVPLDRALVSFYRLSVVIVPLFVTIWAKFAMQILTRGYDPQFDPQLSPSVGEDQGHMMLLGTTRVSLPDGTMTECDRRRDWPRCGNTTAIATPPDNDHNSWDIEYTPMEMLKKPDSNTRFSFYVPFQITHANICKNLILPETRLSVEHFCHWQCGSILLVFTQLFSKVTVSGVRHRYRRENRI